MPVVYWKVVFEIVEPPPQEKKNLGGQSNTLFPGMSDCPSLSLHMVSNGITNYNRIFFYLPNNVTGGVTVCAMSLKRRITIHDEIYEMECRINRAFGVKHAKMWTDNNLILGLFTSKSFSFNVKIPH